MAPPAVSSRARCSSACSSGVREQHPAPSSVPRLLRRRSGIHLHRGSPDGLADVDTPVLEALPRPGAPPATGRARQLAAPSRRLLLRAHHDVTVTPVPPAELTARRLEVPVEGIRRDQLVRTFEQKRSGTRLHEAIDILAPRNTPVVAVEDGTVARLFLSKAGGITVYQFDPSPAILLLLRAPRALRRRPQGGGSRPPGAGPGLRRHFGQCPERHAPPALCDLSADGGQALVGRHPDRPLRYPPLAFQPSEPAWPSNVA